MTDQYSDSALMSTNGLLYKMPQPLSVCVNRTFKKEYAQRQEYTMGSTIAFDVNSGSSYVNAEEGGQASQGWLDFCHFDYFASLRLISHVEYF